jgi:triphosphatase
MPTNRNEFEIKLLFPKNKFRAIEQLFISKGAVQRQHLQAAHIDTPDFMLTQAGVSFRLRKEGRQWVQTLKVITDNSFERLEHKVVRKEVGNVAPNWDLHLHHKSGQLLKERIPKLKVQELQVCCKTDIWRRSMVIKDCHGVIQYAFDSGSISFLSPVGTIAAPIQELSIKLMKGGPHIILKHALKMIKDYGAFIDTCSKFERSFFLASALELGIPVKTKYVALKSARDSPEIISRLIDSCMQQVLANQSALNEECQNYSEYLHQLRIGLRRLKVLFKYLAKYDVHISDKGIEVLNKVFSMFGQYRNNDYVTNVLNPTLLSLGSAEIKLGDVVGLLNPAHITRDKDFQLLLIELMSFGLSQSTPIFHPIANKKNKEGAEVIRKTVTKKLDRRFQFITDQALRFSDLRDDEIHLMRKKMKFIRYSLEFFKDFCIKKVYPNFYKTITTTLDNFGLFNDISVTIDRIEESAQNNPNLLFALGWLKFKRKRVRTLCEKSLKKLVHTSIPWKS